MLNCVIFVIIYFNSLLVLLQLLFLFLEIFDIEIIAKGFACYKIYLFLSLSKLFDALSSSL